MLRRRILEALFKFKSDKDALSYDYGIKLPPETIKEYGRYIGSNQSIVNINNEPYYALYGQDPSPTQVIGNPNLTNTGDPTSPQISAYVNIATYNFKTTSNNQNVTFTFKGSCENPNDFLGATKLDNSDISNLAVKVTGTESKTYTYNVATAGDHFIKVYYYQHNDDTLSNDNAGYFRMTPYDIVNYEYRYKAPDIQTCTLTSYYGWNLASKPAWVKLGKLNDQNQFIEITTDKSGNNDIIIEVQGNPGNSRSGNIVLREKYSGQEVTISVLQEENPHPNDIIVSYGKMTVPQNYTGSNQLNVELIGNTSYTISNVSSGLTVSPMNGSNDKISIYNAQGNNVNGSFRITGNAGTVKDIYISKESSSCYCDCNIFDACSCHINSSFIKKDDNVCPTNNCRANNQISCPKHVENYMNQGNCPAHTSCSCDCQSVNLCTCDQYIVCDKDIQGSTSATCSCHSGHIQGTTSYTLTCSCHSGHIQGTTSYDQTCSCHSGHKQGTTSYTATCSCHSGHSIRVTHSPCACHSGYDKGITSYCSCNEEEIQGTTSYTATCSCHSGHSIRVTHSQCSCHSGYDKGITSYCSCNEEETQGTTSYCSCNTKAVQGTTSYCSCNTKEVQGTTSYTAPCSCHSGYSKESYTDTCSCHSGYQAGTTSYTASCSCHSGYESGSSYCGCNNCYRDYTYTTSCNTNTTTVCTCNTRWSCHCDPNDRTTPGCVPDYGCSTKAAPHCSDGYPSCSGWCSRSGCAHYFNNPKSTTTTSDISGTCNCNRNDPSCNCNGEIIGTTSYTDTCSCHKGYKAGTTSYCSCNTKEVQGTTSYTAPCSCHSGYSKKSYTATCSCHTGYSKKSYTETCSCHTGYSKRPHWATCSCHSGYQEGTHTFCSCDYEHIIGTTSYTETCSCHTGYSKRPHWATCSCHSGYQEGTNTFCSCDYENIIGTTSYTETCSCHSGYQAGTTSYTLTCSCHTGYVKGTTSYTLTCSCHTGYVKGTTSYTCSCHSGYFHETSCHGHDQACSRNQCNAVNPTSCSCNLKTYYPHCDCDQFCKCDGYYVPCESKASRTTASPCAKYTPNP